ncbi:MAG: hypothetical protein OHK0038_01540 [Flammeovirgaceae bacterium]
MKLIYPTITRYIFRIVAIIFFSVGIFALRSFLKDEGYPKSDYSWIKGKVMEFSIDDPKKVKRKFAKSIHLTFEKIDHCFYITNDVENSFQKCIDEGIENELKTGIELEILLPKDVTQNLSQGSPFCKIVYGLKINSKKYFDTDYLNEQHSKYRILRVIFCIIWLLITGTMVLASFANTIKDMMTDKK